MSPVLVLAPAGVDAPTLSATLIALLVLAAGTGLLFGTAWLDRHRLGRLRGRSGVWARACRRIRRARSAPAPGRRGITMRTSRGGAPGTRTPRRTHWSLAGIETFVAVCALGVGVGLIRGDAVAIAVRQSGTPSAGSLASGVLLILVVAVPMATAAALEATRAMAAPLTSVVAGGALVAWAGVQVLATMRVTVFDAVVLAAGLTVMVLAVVVRRHEQLADLSHDPH